MICSSCKSEFDNINGLKFCPYCGAKTEETITSEVEQISDEFKNEEVDNIVEGGTKEKIHQNTLEMPKITEEDIKKYNRDKFFKALREKLMHIRKTFMHMKVIIPIITLLVVIAVGVFGYTTFIFAKPVEEVRIKEDMIGKVITLSKGTTVEIKKGYLKSFSISSRNTDKNKGKDEIKAQVTLNNGTVEVKTLLSLVYIYEGKNKWKISDKIDLAGVALVKPVVGMDEKQFLDGFKKLSITVADVPIALGGETVKNLGIALRTPDLENGKEEILVDAVIDSGLLSATGKIKCKLIFENEIWSIATIERNSTEDFGLILSPAFSQEKIMETIKKEGLEETVTYSNLFGGKGFNVKDSFTKNTNISDKKFDGQKGTLNVTVKRENIAGEIKSTLSTEYTFSISFSKIALLNKSKTTVDSANVGNISTESIVATIANADIEGNNLLFWWSDNHKITTEESKTFKLDEILSKKGYLNIKYVYGSITSMDGKKQVNASFVAIYFLVYDGSKGYSWKLDKIIGEASPSYKTYSKALINQ